MAERIKLLITTQNTPYRDDIQNMRGLRMDWKIPMYKLMVTYGGGVSVGMCK
jgi:hypothetical protein